MINSRRQSPCRTVMPFLLICIVFSTICSAVDFGPPAVYPQMEGVPTAVVLGDFDGDLRTDIAVLLTGSGTNVRILLGNGDGAFSSAVDTDTGADSNYNFSSIVAGDFNGDHTLD